MLVLFVSVCQKVIKCALILLAVLTLAIRGDFYISIFGTVQYKIEVSFNQRRIICSCFIRRIFVSTDVLNFPLFPPFFAEYLKVPRDFVI